MVSVFSYLSLGDKAATVDLFIFRKVKKGDSDVIMIIMRFLLLLSVVVSAGLNMFPIKEFILGDKIKTIKWWKNLLLSFILVLIPTVLASQFTSITNYM